MNRKPGRSARGFKEHLCRQCMTGLTAGAIKTFDQKCEGCQKKKASGLRTGLEPSPHFRLGEKLVSHEFRGKQRAAMAEIRARQLAVPRMCFSR